MESVAVQHGLEAVSRCIEVLLVFSVLRLDYNSHFCGIIQRHD